MISVQYVWFVWSLMFLILWFLLYLLYPRIILFIFTGIEISKRNGLYTGYFDGYEQGFCDAATKYLGWMSNLQEGTAITTTLKEIETNENDIDPENKLEREKQVNEGYVKLLGWLITWRKLPNR